jgi:hypothetical protein
VRPEDSFHAFVGVALVMAAGLVAWSPGRGEVDPAKSGGVGVPDTIHSVPAGALEPTSELAVGRAAAVLMSEDELPVVIDAADGGYTALDLPDFGPTQRGQGAVSLTPTAAAWPGAIPRPRRRPAAARRPGCGSSTW